MEESKISKELSAIAEKSMPEDQVNVIVTVTEGTRIEDAVRMVEEFGLSETIGEPTPEGPPLVITGSVRARDIPKLAKLPEVKKVEHDSLMHPQ